MKHLLLIVPILLLFIVSSCAAGTPTPLPNEIGTAVAMTQTASVWTPIPSPTPNANIPNIITWLNSDISGISPLGATMDAEYQVINLSFPNIPDSSGLSFRVDVSCMCLNDSKCCIPERTFVVVIESMKRNSSTVLPLVPSGTIEVIVACSDRQTKAQIGSVTASWPDVQGYLQGYVSGYQLGVRTVRNAAP